MKKITILLLTILIAYSCNKETKIEEKIYEVKEFIPTSNNNANYLVQNFLKKVPNSSVHVYNTTKTSTSEDKEPNESTWIIEGASNFERRTRTFLTSEDIEEFTLSIDNYTDSDGSLKINETELLSKYADIENLIATKEGELNKSSKFVNVDIVSINSTTTSLKVSTIYGQVSSTATTSGWATPTDPIHCAEIINDSINNYLSINVVNVTIGSMPTPPIPPSGTAWANPAAGSYVWYGGINNVLNGTLDAWNVNAFCTRCLFASDLHAAGNPLANWNSSNNSAWFSWYYSQAQMAAQMKIDENVTAPAGELISLILQGEFIPSLNGNLNWFHILESVSTANAYYWIPNPNLGS